MTRDEAVSQIQFDLGNRSDLADQIALKLQQAQRLLEQGRSLPYFLKLEDQTLTVPSGSADVAFPTGFLREAPLETFHYESDEGDNVFLQKVDLWNAFATFDSDSSPGRPKAYAIRKAAFSFFPSRDVSYDLSWSYYKTATILTSNVADNAWLVYAPDVLIGLAGSMIAEVIQHAAAKARFDALLTKAWADAFSEGILREEENYPLEMGSRV